MAVTSVNSSIGNSADLYKLLQQVKGQNGKANTKGTDSDGDHDGSKPGEVESSSGVDKLA